jgi:hypothetical protein
MIVYDSKAAQDTERSCLAPEIIQQHSRTPDAPVLQAGNQVLDAGTGTAVRLLFCVKRILFTAVK